MASPGRTSKILVAIAGGVLGLTILAIALLALFLPSDAIRAYAVQEAATYLDRPVDIGDVGLALLPHIGAEVTDVSIGNNPALADEPLVVIDRVVISVGIWRLITGGEVHVSEITVEHPRVAFVVGADGSSSLEGLLKEIDADATPQTATSTTMPIGIQLDHFNVVGGSVFYDDRQAGTTVQIASIDQTLGVTVDAAANNISATGQLSLTGVETTFAEDGTGPFDVSL
ncbi:MAG: AsmA family protein, partial [Gemmatimonadetes bacterium]|nr:AsmA family protein [Gemmatimonadota bacterium]